MSEEKDVRTVDVHEEEEDADRDEGAVGFSESTFLVPWMRLDMLRALFARNMALPRHHAPVLEEMTLNGIAKYIQSGKGKRILCMVGAGISTSAGIPDFRSPGSGLYHNLQKYNLPHPQAIFEMSYFKMNPQPFFTLAKELYPGEFKPTFSHYFMRFLQDKGLLLRCYTQNIDTLERVAGITGDNLVEAHGSFHTSHCLSCGKVFTLTWMKEEIFKDKVPVCDECEGLVKPDIVFFGESLPQRFFQCIQKDCSDCDLLIIMGTSLVVQPFSSLTNRVSETTPRLLLNMERSGQTDPIMAALGLGSGMDFDSENAYRDVAWLGKCDDGCLALAELLGWKEEFEALVTAEHSRIDEELTTVKPQGATTEVHHP
uniref:NAD-dependent protein deacetylase sirtuin-2 isoform X1 n=1 Tax=Myxine glutinosa TaxID=7769 RepID=UPI00358ED4A8